VMTPSVKNNDSGAIVININVIQVEDHHLVVAVTIC